MRISMESEESSRPSIGFPLGLALLLVMLFLMSGFFTCCLYWDKLRSQLGASSEEDNHTHQHTEHLPQKPAPPHQESKKNRAESLPVLMPGDEVPRFIAMACPCEPPLPEKIIVKVHKPPTFPIPLYL